MNEDIKESRLENGLVVLTDRMPGVRSATLGFFYRVGSRNEPDELNGITHFIEHCVFKGTVKRSAVEIAIEQDRLGGNLDAFTTHEETGFVIKVTDDRIEHAFDLLSDMLTNPRFDEGDLINERRVIIEEMKMNEDSPEEVLGDIFHREFFPGHQLGMSITGIAETVKTFGHELTRNYHKQVFNPANLIIVAAGNVEHEGLLDLVRSSNFSWPPAETRQLKLELQTPAPASPIIIEHRADLEQAHMIIATPLVGATDERRYAADHLSNIIGGGTSSRLWQKVREERGLAYSVGSSAVMFQDSGFFSVSAAISPEHAEQVLRIVVDEMRSVVSSGVNEDELQLVKDQARASILLGLEDSASRAGALAQSELIHGRQIPVEETLAKLDAVNADDVQQIAREFFKTDKVAFVALGDLDGLHIDRNRLAID